MEYYDIGVIAVVVVCIAVAWTLFMRHVTRRDVESRKIMFISPHQRRRVDLSEFRGLNVQAYEQARAELEALGFRYLADIEDVTLTTTQMDPHAPGRYLLSKDGNVSAVFLQVRFSPLIALLARLTIGHNPFIVAFQTRFADASVLMTQRCTPKFMDCEPPEIVAVAVDPRHSIAETYEALRTLMEFRPDLVPVPMRNLDDVQSLESYMEGLRRQYRLRVGLYIVEDLVRQGATEESARQTIRNMEKMLVGDPVWDPALRPKSGEAMR